LAKLGNIFLVNTEKSQNYKSGPSRGGGKFPTRRDETAHGLFLQRELNKAYRRSDAQKQAAAIRYKTGTYLEISGAPGVDLALNKRENLQAGIKLLNVRSAEIDVEEKKVSVSKATIYIPDGKELVLLKKFKEYTDELTEKGNRKQAELGSSVEDVKLALLEAFWIGKITEMPTENVPEWCEVWLRFDASRNEIITEQNITAVQSDFLECCEEYGIEVKDGKIIFPERIVKLVNATKSQLNSLIEASDYLAEFRKAPEQLDFLNHLTGGEQREWIDNLLERSSFPDRSKNVVCILDTGVASKHFLLDPVIGSPKHIQAYDSRWNTEDHDGHGTEMAGLAIYNDLKSELESSSQVKINHRLESVKILPPTGANEPELYGDITEQSVLMAEIENPNANRAICMAVTAPDPHSFDGSPSSWSAAIDQIIAGEGYQDTHRLFFISAGNVEPHEFEDLPYPDANIMHNVENPGQAWNAITVGAYSNQITTTDGLNPVANVGDLSPFSSTSVNWKDDWPVKPEVVFEGGNLGTNGTDYDISDDLILLTTGRSFTTTPLSAIWGTSAATAKASWFAAQIYNEYPNIWPETVRALIIHSAQWSNNMRACFNNDNKKRTGIRSLLRSCGYGIPNLERAIESKSNAVNLVVEGTIQPFRTGKKMNEMHIHELPWPKKVLEELGAVDAKLKVTLSYFIEPGPGEIGWKNRYRYASSSLRFEVINNNENLEDFEKRINAAMREEKDDTGDGTSRDWFIGKKNREKGSVHSDFCEGTAVDLSEANYVAVFPVIGWWRERNYLGKTNEKLKYSLVVSIETPSVEADLYNEIITQISVKQPIEIEIPTE
jgi:hypothetical protein